MDDLISVIIPVYNAEKYIERCVKSIQNQTYTHFELILVNDGSTDNSLNLCEILASNDERIVVVNRDNGGASAARNTGLAHIRGNYVIFADSDDYVSPSYLENLYLQQNKVIMILYNVIWKAHLILIKNFKQLPLILLM